MVRLLHESLALVKKLRNMGRVYRFYPEFSKTDFSPQRKEKEYVV
jgi:hypothetical protein